MSLALITLNSDAALVDPDLPWMTSRAEEWDARSAAEWIEGLSGCGDDVKRALRFELENNQAVPVDKQSYLGLLATVHGGALSNLSRLKRRPSEFWTESEVFRCATGNQQLAESFKAAIDASGSDNRVILSTPAKRVEVDSSGVNVVAEDGTPHPAEWVVISVPPSCWSTLELPGEVQCSAVPMGPAIKYLSYVRERFWVREGLAPSGTDDSFGMIWEGTDNQNLRPGDMAEISVFAGGDVATKGINAEKADEYFRSGLERIYPGFRGEVAETTFLNWPGETWTKGGYSCLAPTQVTTVARCLFESLGRVIWAGEHTCMAFFGYMEGALRSGIHAGQLIARREQIPEAEKIWEARLSQCESRKEARFDMSDPL